MIIDIRFTDNPPIQYQDVRRTSVYMHSDGTAVPELIIYFKQFDREHVNLPLRQIIDWTVTND